MHLSAPPRPHRFLKSLPGALQPPACPVGPIEWQCLAWGTSLGLAVPQGGADARLTALQRGRSGDLPSALLCSQTEGKRPELTSRDSGSSTGSAATLGNLC